MPKLIRQLKSKIWLDRQIADELGGLQADSLKNFQTSENTLSVFTVDENCPQESAMRILAAIACGKDSPDKVDYAIFDAEILNNLKIKINESHGNTPDPHVNKLHLDLQNLTADSICNLALYIQNSGLLDRFLRKDIEKEINKGIEVGQLEIKKINPKLLQKIKQMETN